MTHITDQPTSRSGAATVDRASIWRATGIAAAAAAVANLVVALLAKAADVTFEVAPMGSDERQSIPVAAFAIATAVGALLGGGIAPLLAPRSAAGRTFLIVSLAGTALSAIPPLAADADTSMKVVLVISHVVAAAIILPLIARRLPR